MPNEGILFFCRLQLLLLFNFAMLIMSLTNWDVHWTSWVLLTLSSSKWLGSLGNSPTVMKSHSCLPSRLVEGRREGIYSRYCKAPGYWDSTFYLPSWQLYVCAVSLILWIGTWSTPTLTLPKEFRGVAYGFVCVFCSVLHILFYIKITEVDHFGLAEILLKTFL